MPIIRNFCLKAKTIYQLGLHNVLNVFAYRVLIRLGIHPVQSIHREVSVGPFFKKAEYKGSNPVPTNYWNSDALFFGWYKEKLTNEPPNWHRNPFNGKSFKGTEESWWKLSDFQSDVGDIKAVWDSSRFEWVLAFAQRIRNGDAASLERMNNWLIDWCKKNPPYLGPNWKCGQEASIRVMHLATVALILRQESLPMSGLLELVRTHLCRIAPTIRYAIAQDNNHGTSEAVALFIGGIWLNKKGYSEGLRFAETGRYWLENRALRLIGSQGSFSQSSLNYHRLMLDTFCIAEVWRQNWEQPKFSKQCYQRLQAATEWLRHIVESSTGDAPNLGANDGARILPLTATRYRDYRPTVQLSSVLFSGFRAYPIGPWDDALHWLGISLPQQVAPKTETYLADDGGFAMLRQGEAFALFRYPRFSFRPSQSDALHVDLWLGQENLLRDAGSFSYNTENHWLYYFSGTEAHNTIQFDDRDQMPRIGRFLMGSWLKTNWTKPLCSKKGCVSFGAGYLDEQGASHRRELELSTHSLRVEDHVAGFSKKAVMRWRLAPGNWVFKQESQEVHLSCENSTSPILTIKSSVPLIRTEMNVGWESRYYHKKTELPVLEVEVSSPGSLISEIHWAD